MGAGSEFSVGRIALDIWRASGATGGGWVVNAWWAAWLAKTVGGFFALRGASQPQPFSLVPQAANLAAAILAILVIQRITAAQSAKFGALDSGRGVVGEVAAQ